MSGFFVSLISIGCSGLVPTTDAGSGGGDAGTASAGGAAPSSQSYVVDACPGGTELWVIPVAESTPVQCSDSEQIRTRVVGVFGGGTASACSVSDSSGTFTLSFNQDIPGQDPVAQVDMDAAAIYGSDRDALRTAFLEFRQALFVAQTTAEQACLLPGSNELVLQRLAEAMPLPMDELLRYRYGLETGDANQIELTPGMRLRIQDSAYLNQTDSVGTYGAETAFHASGTTVLYVRSDALGAATDVPNIGLNKLYQGMAFQVTQVSPGTQGLWAFPNIRYASTAIDLSVAAELAPYLAVSYPPANLAWPALNASQTGPQGNAVVVRAASPDALQDWLVQLAPGDSTSHKACDTGGSGTNNCVVWIGRGAPVPEIRVVLDEQVLWVPVGTTVRDLLQQTVDWSTPGTGPTSNQVTGLLTRQISLAGSSASTGTDTISVVFPGVSSLTANASDALAATSFDLPLVRGDQLHVLTSK